MNVVARHRLGVVVTLAAILLLVGIAAAARLGHPRLSRSGETRTIIRTVGQALGHWQTDNDAVCPPSLATLFDEHYLTRVPRDGWGHPLRYQCPGSHAEWGADVASAGPDGLYDTGDDIRSWEP